MILASIIISLALILIVWDIIRLPNITDLGVDTNAKDKLREFMISDIRTNSQYCASFLGFIGLIGTIAATSKIYEKPILTCAVFWPFIISLVAASLATLFIPVGYGCDSFKRLKYIWLRSVICEQVVVIFTAYGIWKIIVTLF